jgi:hypothetical protein
VTTTWAGGLALLRADADPRTVAWVEAKLVDLGLVEPDVDELARRALEAARAADARVLGFMFDGLVGDAEYYDPLGRPRWRLALCVVWRDLPLNGRLLEELRPAKEAIAAQAPSSVRVEVTPWVLSDFRRSLKDGRRPAHVAGEALLKELA